MIPYMWWHRRFNARLVRALLWTAVIVGAAATINIIGIRLVGDVEGWSRWMRVHSGIFLVWRLCVYGATGYGWWRTRGRLRQREPSAEAHRRLLRTEIASILAIALLEGSELMRHR